MSLILAGMFGGLGKGMADFGRMQYELEEKKAARLEELRERAELSAALGVGGGAGGLGRGGSRAGAAGRPSDMELKVDLFKELAKDPVMGLQAPKAEDYIREKEAFTGGTDYSKTEEVDAGEGNDGYRDAVSRKLSSANKTIEKALDKDALDRDTARVASKKIGLLIAVMKPEALDDHQKAETQAIINRALEAAERAETPAAKKTLTEAATKLAIAAKGGKQHDVNAGTVYDTTTGEHEITEAGKAKAASDARTADARVIQANRPPAARGGGTGGALRVSKTYTNADGNMVAVMSDGTEKVLGKSGAVEKDVAKVISDMEKNGATVEINGKRVRLSTLPEAQKREIALSRLGQSPVAPAAATAPANRRPLSAFQTK